MQQPPRDADESVLTRRHWLIIGGWSVIIAACVLAALLIAQHWYGFEKLHAVTISFLTLAFAKLWFVFNLRDPGSTISGNDIVRNPWIWASIVLCIGLLLIAVYFPALSSLLETTSLSLEGWGIVLTISLVPLLIGQTIRAFR